MFDALCVVNITKDNFTFDILQSKMFDLGTLSELLRD